jgi:hypothetical protein
MFSPLLIKYLKIFYTNDLMATSWQLHGNVMDTSWILHGYFMDTV